MSNNRKKSKKRKSIRNKKPILPYTKNKYQPSINFTHDEKISFFQDLNELENLIQGQITMEYPITVLFIDGDTLWTYFAMIANKHNITKMNRVKYHTLLDFLCNAYWNIFNFFQSLYNHEIDPSAAIEGILEIKRLYIGNQVLVTKSFTNFLQTLINHLKTLK